MAEKTKDKIAKAGQKISEAAARAGHAASEKAEQASDWAKEKMHEAGHRLEEAKQKLEHRTGVQLSDPDRPTCASADIREHMDVVASCGTKVGRVDHVEGDTIKLTKNDSVDGQHHRIPLAWVASVDDTVHLDRDHIAVQGQWERA